MAILTPPVISRLPLGLLRFLGIQSGGQYPGSLQPQLQTTFDTLELLYGSHREQIVETISVTATGVTLFNASRVPQQEVWFLRAASVGLISDVAEAWSGNLVYTPGNQGPGPTGTHPLTVFNSIGASENFRIGTLQNGIGGGHFLGPGDVLGMHTQAVTGSISSTLLISFLRFPI